MNTGLLFQLLDFEPYFLLLGLFALAWLFYQFFLREVSEERHKKLQNHIANIFRYFIFFTATFIVFNILHKGAADSYFSKLTPYVALLCLAMGMIVFVKICRLIILQYLFLGSMKHGVPLLIVNIFSLIMSMILLMWMAASIFSIEVTPLLATSAAFSVVLGLAMQDTLGNLFAGISLQIDQAYDIGDWLEVTSGSQKFVGQVKEISWRATLLVGWSEEQIIVPNRFIANSQISNFSLSEQPILRSLNFKVQYGTDLDKARSIILTALSKIAAIKKWPEPLVLINDLNESWVNMKLIYYIENYGSQYIILDQVSQQCLQDLTTEGIEIARQRVEVKPPLNN